MDRKVLYLVRHCKADGQDPDAALTPEGEVQAEALADFFGGRGIDRIITSPFARAVQSIEPTARRLGLGITKDIRLSERVLSSESYPDWEDRLRRTFLDLDLSFVGGESSRAAMARGVAVVEEIMRDVSRSAILVSHGCLITLVLKYFDDRYGFHDWARMTTPDVFRVAVESAGPRVDRIWRS